MSQGHNKLLGDKYYVSQMAGPDPCGLLRVIESGLMLPKLRVFSIFSSRASVPLTDYNVISPDTHMRSEDVYSFLTDLNSMLKQK